MGKEGLMWCSDDDTMTLEEYRKARGQSDHKKSDFIESIGDNYQEDSNDVWQEQ